MREIPCRKGLVLAAWLREKRKSRGEELSQTYRGRCWHTAGGEGFPWTREIPSWSRARALVRSVSRRGNFSSPSLRILRLHSPQLLPLPLFRRVFDDLYSSHSLPTSQLSALRRCSSPGYGWTLALTHERHRRTAESSRQGCTEHPAFLPALLAPLSAPGRFGCSICSLLLPPFPQPFEQPSLSFLLLVTTDAEEQRLVKQRGSTACLGICCSQTCPPPAEEEGISALQQTGCRRGKL